MFREDMDDAHGMLFVFEDQRDVGFWMKNTPMPLDLLFIAQDGTVKAIKPGVVDVGGGDIARRAGALRARAEGRHRREERHRRRRQGAPPCDQPGSGAAQPVHGIATRMRLFRHEGFDLAYIDQRPASGTCRAGAAHPRLCVEPFHQLGGARLGEDAQRRRLPGDRLRQSRPRRLVEELRSGRLSSGPHGRRCGSAAWPSRHRPGACVRLFDGRAHLRVPGAGRAAIGRDA